MLNLILIIGFYLLVSGATPFYCPVKLRFCVRSNSCIVVRFRPIFALRYVDSFYINDTNTLKLPSYTTVDLTLDYTYNKKTTFSFLLKNLTDELYATTAKNDTGGVYLGEARSFEFGVNYKF